MYELIRLRAQEFISTQPSKGIHRICINTASLLDGPIIEYSELASYFVPDLSSNLFITIWIEFFVASITIHALEETL